ncbi:carbohydrate-binding family 9-like protein [uncultured Draconibacterium sp.]|uniref:carbohydrate-binding family 9-like protein n=1 Tax=uncultured Draconibacterium sp. TaxID=1573823 RepID=UPI003217B3CD
MTIRTGIFLIWGTILTVLQGSAQNSREGFEHLFEPVETYVVYKTTGEINVDGKAGEKDWQLAKWSEAFNDIEGDVKPAPAYQTRMKMVWDESNLYIYAELEEPHIWAYYDKNDMIVYHENDFEVFIDPERDAHAYYEFEVNARNTLFDLFMNKPYRNGGKANIEWNAKGFKSAVYIDGTLNDASDEDVKWTVEMQIPFSSLRLDGPFVQPKNRDVWKINFSRVEWQTELIDAIYVRKTDSGKKKLLPENNWVWSPQGVINMHYPERWSMVQFSENPLTQQKVSFSLPEEEIWAKYVWLIYYKQQSYKSENGQYSPTLTLLDIPEKGTADGVSYTLKLNADNTIYTATLETANGLKIWINEQGLFKVLTNK